MARWKDKEKRLAFYKRRSLKPYRRYYNCKVGARVRGYTFTLTREEYDKIIVEDCYYCGEKPLPFNGVDRKDNSIGYESGNCVPCCRICNRMKLTLKIEDFIGRCIRISKKHSDDSLHR